MKKITLALALILMPLNAIMAQKENCCNTQSGCFHRTLLSFHGIRHLNFSLSYK